MVCTAGHNGPCCVRILPWGHLFPAPLMDTSLAFTDLGEDSGGPVCRLHCEVIAGLLLCIKGLGDNDGSGALVHIKVTVIVAP